jgi:hypothetical protein
MMTAAISDGVKNRVIGAFLKIMHQHMPSHTIPAKD